MELSSTTPTFSIVVPVYNSSGTLKRCLDSILNQGFQSYEVICVDDGSSDSSWDILGEYALQNSRIRRFSQSNAGPAAARNRGVKEALGEYVLFVDSDDYFYVDNALAILKETIVSNGGSDLVYFAGAFVETDGVYPDNSKQSKVFDYGYQCMEENCLNSKGLVFGSVYAQCCRRSLLEDYGIRFNERLIYGEDRLFVCSLYYFANKTIEIPDVLYCYVVNNSSSLMRDENKRIRLESDNRQVVYQLDSLLQKGAYKQPKLKKYIHGLYVQGIGGMKKEDIDWRLIFRNASTLKLWVKDILLYCGLLHY